jgi:hypothetical protein
VPEPLQPQAIVRTLAKHKVEYVLIGGLAAVLHGSPAMTNDADICPDPSVDNLRRLAAALRDMDARIRSDGVPDGLKFAVDEHFLSKMPMVNCTTRYGDFDITSHPAGFDRGYADLVPHAVEFRVDKTRVKVAALVDIIRSKETANRAKDQATLPLLYALQDELAQRQPGS